jgi:hypothetical protein
MTRPGIGLELEVSVRLRATSEGGRRTAILGGYRPLSVLSQEDGSKVYVGLSELDLGEPIAPGTVGDGVLRFDRTVSDLVCRLVGRGSQFELAEGTNVVGTAHVNGVRKLD